MGWNEPEKGNDPWKGKNQPPDLDEALKRLQERLKKAFGGNGTKESGEQGRSSGTGGGLLGLIILLVIAALWFLSGIFIVDPAEQAAILYFGKYSETVGPGPHWIPRIAASSIVRNVDRVMDYSYSGQMLTKDEKLVAASVVVQYRIGDLQDYLFNVVDPVESLEQATSSALREVLGTTTLDSIITEGREIWGARVQTTLVNILSRYKTGVIIVNVSPQPARAPESVQEAFDDAIKAQEDEKRFKEQALAYAAQVVPIAKGNAQRVTQEAEAYARQVVLQAQGEVAEFMALLPQYVAAPQVTAERMYLDAMQKVLRQSTKIIVDSKASNMLYLPIDKLFSRTTLPSAASSDNQASGQSTKDSTNLVDGRTLVRPTYDLGSN